MLVHRIDTLNCTKRTQDPRYVKGGWVGGGEGILVQVCMYMDAVLRRNIYAVLEDWMDK